MKKLPDRQVADEVHPDQAGDDDDDDSEDDLDYQPGQDSDDDDEDEEEEVEEQQHDQEKPKNDRRRRKRDDDDAVSEDEIEYLRKDAQEITGDTDRKRLRVNQTEEDPFLVAERKAKAEEIWKQMQAKSKSSALPRTNASVAVSSSSSSSSVARNSKEPSEVVVQKEFIFAGERVLIPTKVSASEAAKISSRSAAVGGAFGATAITATTTSTATSTTTPITTSTTAGTSRTTGAISNAAAAATSYSSSVKPSPVTSATAKPKSRLASLLEQQDDSKNLTKLTTLEKSKLDWNQFVDKEGIRDELTQNKKDGYVVWRYRDFDIINDSYLDKMDFLKRTSEREELDFAKMRQASRK